MQTIELTVFSFNELSSAAKVKARDWYRDGALDYDWYGSVFDDAKTIAAVIGIDVDDISFSGFSSQGDGASFSGSYRYEKGGLRNVKQHAPLDTALHDIALALQQIQAVNFYQVQADITKTGRYQHSGTMRLNAYRDDGKDFNDDDDLLAVMRTFADWIYSRLEREYDWLMSDEQIDDTIIANEYEFNDDGSIYHG